MSIVRIVVGVVLFLTAQVLLFLANQQYWELRFEVNAILPPAEQFEPTFWWWGTWQEFKRLHRRVLPDSPRPRRARRYAAAAFAAFLAAIALLLPLASK